MIIEIPSFAYWILGFICGFTIMVNLIFHFTDFKIKGID